MRYFRTGEMAQLCHVSKRTLQTYDEWGLIKPARTDLSNGYRYYTLDQCPRMDFIMYMKQLGFSLYDIKKLMDDPEPDTLYQRLCNTRRELAADRRRLSESLHTLGRVIDNISLFRNMPETGVCRIQQYHQRHIIVYRDERCAYGYKSDRDSMINWELLLKSFETYLLSHGVSLSQLRNVGGVIRKQCLLKRKLYIADAFISVSDDFDLLPTETMPEGYYMTYLCASVIGRDATPSEQDAFWLMLDEIERTGCEIVGDYYGEEIAAGPAMNYQGFDAMVRCMIPIRPPKCFLEQAQLTNDNSRAIETDFS